MINGALKNFVFLDFFLQNFKITFIQKSKFRIFLYLKENEASHHSQ